MESRVGYECEAKCVREVYLNGARAICVRESVYKPAEDTWLALEAVKEISGRALPGRMR